MKDIMSNIKNWFESSINQSTIKQSIRVKWRTLGFSDEEIYRLFDLKRSKPDIDYMKQLLERRIN